MNGKNYEPTPRWCGGKFGVVSHRFPIKNSVTFWQAYSNKIEENVIRSNDFMRKMMVNLYSDPNDQPAMDEVKQHQKYKHKSYVVKITLDKL